MFGSISILNTRYKRFAQVIALKTGFLQQMWRVTIVPLLLRVRRCLRIDETVPMAGRSGAGVC